MTEGPSPSDELKENIITIEELHPCIKVRRHTL